MGSKVIWTDKNIFKFGNIVTNIVSVDVILKSVSYNFWIYFYILGFKWVRSLLMSFSVKFQVSTIHKTYNCFGMKEQKKLDHIFLRKFQKVLVELFFWVVAVEVDFYYSCLWRSLLLLLVKFGLYYKWQWQSLRRSLYLVKIQTFLYNGSDGVWF